MKVLQAQGVEYAIKLPFYPWVGLKQRARGHLWTTR